MPAALVKSLAKDTGIEFLEAEKRWKKAKAITEKETGLNEKDGDDFWKYVTGVFKKSMGIGAVMEGVVDSSCVSPYTGKIHATRMQFLPPSPFEDYTKDTCPVCGEPGTKATRGFTSDRACDNGHWWYWMRGEKHIGIATDKYIVTIISESAKSEEIHVAAHEAATSHLNDLPQPTEAQARAGVYKKGHIRLHGMGISIENPKGSERSGVDPNGVAWSVTMPAHYGYIKKTVAPDGDNFDVYIGDNPESEQVFVVDQLDAETGKYDECKGILGCKTPEEARQLYCSGFSDGKGADRIGAITELSIDTFKKWLREGDTMKPVSNAILESASNGWRNSLQSATSFEDIRKVFADLWPGLFAQDIGRPRIYEVRLIDQGFKLQTNIDGEIIELRLAGSIAQRQKNGLWKVYEGDVSEGNLVGDDFTLNEAENELKDMVATDTGSFTAAAPVTSTSILSKGKGEPNTVYRDIYNLYTNEHMGMMQEPYDGTLEDLLRVYKKFQYDLNDWRDASNSESPIAATDASGLPKYYVSPNARFITDLQTGDEINTDRYMQR